MSELNYYKLEQRDSFDIDKTRTVYRIKNKGLVTGDDFVREVEHRSGIKASTIQAVLMEVAEELEELLGWGYAVTLPGIGAFSLGVHLKEERSQQLNEELLAAELAQRQGKRTGNVAEPNSTAIEPHHINFRKDKVFFKNIKNRFSQLTLSRIGGKGGSRITIDDKGESERIALAMRYLDSHPYIRIADYMSLTGLSRSSAQRELVEFGKSERVDLWPTGRGSHRVYVRANNTPTP